MTVYRACLDNTTTLGGVLEVDAKDRRPFQSPTPSHHLSRIETGL